MMIMNGSAKVPMFSYIKAMEASKSAGFDDDACESWFHEQHLNFGAGTLFLPKIL